MNRTVFKYPMNQSSHGRLFLTMPRGAQLLHVSLQDGQMCLWALIDQGEFQLEQRAVNALWTDWPAPESPGRYMNSVQQGALVWHFFDDGAV
jgi:hypothetical protein